MSAEPLVSVYIPCRNYGRFLSQAIDSVIGQLFDSWELFIIDEASDDDSLEIARAYERRDPSRIKVIANESPVGLQRVANDVLGRVRGKYIVRLDADDWLDECALLLMATKLESDPELGLVYGNYFYTDEAGHVLGTERRHELGEEDVVGHLPPHGACTMVSTRALKAVGGYSEDVNAQDGWELWFKLRERVGVANLTVPLFYYRQHNTSLSRDSTRLLAARAKIFEKLAKHLEGGFEPQCMAVIAVRESYKGFEGVPYRSFEGIPLLRRSLESVAGARGITDVVVSSESPRALAYAKSLEEQGLVPPHRRLLRESSEASHGVPIHSILLQSGRSLFEETGRLPDVGAFLSLHAVRRRPEHLEKAMNVLRVTQSDSVVSVEEGREPLFTYGKHGLSLVNPGRFDHLSYDRERVYTFNGTILASWWEVIESGAILGQNLAYVEMSAHDSLQTKSSHLLSEPDYSLIPPSSC